MIEAWRLCRRRYADLTGEGARHWGGRWNRRGRPVVYLAEHPALAVLEVLVHLDLPPDMLPSDHVMTRALLPEGSIKTIAALPEDPLEAGELWLSAAAAAVLRVPSVLVPHAWNLLLNPLHDAAADAHIAAEHPFRFDPRLLRVP